MRRSWKALSAMGGFLTRSREPRVRFKTRGSKAGSEPGSELKALGRVLTGASRASLEEQRESVRGAERERFPKSGIAETLRGNLPTEAEGREKMQREKGEAEEEKKRRSRR